MSDLAALWALEPGLRYLNHGSFGACPRAVLEVQAQLRAELEAQPMRFFRALEERLDGVRAELGPVIGADPAGLALVTNATEGVNAVLRSLSLEPDDEIVVTDHGYAACVNAARFVAERAGARVVTARVPFPIEAPEQATAAVIDAVTDRTRLVLIDHVTSPTALVLPVADIAAALADRGVDLLIDGAHAPGMLPLSIESIGAAYYVGNLHKWLCAPKSAGFLWTRDDRRDAVWPTVISHGYVPYRDDRSHYHMQFDWTGTRDATAALSVPAALRVLGGLFPDGLDGLMARNHELVVAARRHVAGALGLELPAPESMLGSMASLRLPRQAFDGPVDRDELALLEQGIQTVIMPWPASPDRLLRLSAQAYNDLADFEALAAALAPRLAAR